MQIKRIIAGGLLAAATGATLFAGSIFAQNLGDFVAVADGGLASPLVVIGAASQSIDSIAAADLAAGVAGYATTPIHVAGAGTVSVTGGVDVSTPSKPLFVGSAMDRGKDTLTSDDLPDVLASGSFSDDSGAEYKYDQFIVLGSRTIKFDDSGNDLDDPAIHVDVGTSTSSPLLSFRVDFTDPPIMNSTTVEGNSLDIFGSTFTVDPATTGTKAVLQGGGLRQLIKEGESVTVTVDGKEYTVSLLGVSDANTAIVQVNGVSDTIDEDVSKKINGLTVFLDRVDFFSKEAQVSDVEILLGSRKLILENGNQVKMGQNEDVLDNTLVTLTGQSTGAVDQIKIDVAAQDSNLDHILAGEKLLDPIFGGVYVAFNGLTPALDDPSRTLIQFSTAGDDEATLKFTDWRGDERSFPWAFDANTGSTSNQIAFSNNDGDQIVVIEGNTVDENDFFTISFGDVNRLDFGHLFEITSVNSLGTTSSQVTLRDFFTQKSIDVNLGTDNADQHAIDGIDVYVNVTGTDSTDAQNVRFFWEEAGNKDATFIQPGTTTTVFPLLKAKNGARIAMTNVSTTTFNTTNVGHIFKLPTGYLNVTEAGSNDARIWIAVQPYQVNGETQGSVMNLTNATTATAEQTITIGKVNYNVTHTASTRAMSFELTAASGNPAILVLTPENDDNQYEALTVQTGQNSDGLTITTPTFTDGVGTFTKTSNSDISQAVDEWGTLWEIDTNNQGDLKGWFPSEQAVATVAIGKDPKFSATAGGATVESALKITEPISRFDNEVSTSNLKGDLVLVGGPCVNTLVAQLLDKDQQCSNWSHTKGIVWTVSDAFGSGHKALIVAGTTGGDTRDLAAKVLSQGTANYQA